MDQILEFVSYRTLLAEHQHHANLSDHSLQFNLTEAADILAEFQQAAFFKDLTFTTVLLLSLYTPVFLLALLGNLLVLVTLFRERRTLLKAKNLYLLNLAVADLCVTLLCMPAAVGTIVNRLWLYGEFLCKFIAFLQGVAVASSIFTLTAMSVDRYISIQHPMKSLTGMTSRQAVAIVTMTWLVAAIFMGPLLYVREVDVLTFQDIPDFPEMTFCIENWPQDYDRHIFGLFLLVVIFLLPSLTLAVCYAHVGRTLCSKNDDHNRQSSIDSTAVRMRSRKRAARMLITLVVVFILFWLPYNITSLCIDLAESSRPLDVLPYTLCLGHAHSAINPIMYWMMNRRFRHNVSSLARTVKTSTSLLCGSAAHRRDVPRYV